MVGIASAAIYSVLEPISAATGLSLSDLNAGTGYMFLAFGWGCLFWQPIALQYGYVWFSHCFVLIYEENRVGGNVESLTRTVINYHYSNLRMFDSHSNTNNGFRKRPVYLFSMLATLGIMVWVPKATTNGQWIGSKLLQGFVGAPIESLCEISIADIHFAHNRGTYMGLYAFMLAGSNYVAPIMAGFINDGQGWEWVQ